jgi:large subunit ribosomal protein L3
VGHRKKHGPKRGSLAYLPRGRAKRQIGRIRYWPEVEKEPTLLGFSGYKAGMTYVFMVEDKQRSPNYGKEVAYPVTVIDTPPMIICAIKTYIKDIDGLRTFTEAWATSLPKDLERSKGVPKKTILEEKIKKIGENLDKIVKIHVLAASQPRLTSVPKKKPDIMEIKISGGTLEEQFEYSKNLLGKAIQAEMVFKEGQFVDAVSVTKGKGWQGVVKRWGVRILQHKANKTKRGIAALGPWKPTRIRYTVPRAGQMGYHQRTEYNKRILKIGKEGKEITPNGGFLHYGLVKNNYILLLGSVPGPSKRLIRLRYPARSPKEGSETPPQITYISLKSLQGA